MRYPRALPLSLFTLLAFSTGCPETQMKPPKDVWAPDDEWSKLSPSKEWLYATADFSGPHKAECDHVLASVKGEESCKGVLCGFGRDLAAEWITRCTPIKDASVVASVEATRSELTKRAAMPATECAKRFDHLLRKGCGEEDAACTATGQRWATRCGKGEGTPLVMHILARTIERKQESGADPVKLDPRSCEDLVTEVMAAGKCAHRFACEEQVERVATYRARCESESERPSIATAVNELAVLVGADKAKETIVVQAGAAPVKPGDVPVALADGSGAILLVCNDRASDFERYVAARKSCEKGEMVVARAFPTPNGLEVRVGSLDFPNDAAFSERYPTILAAGEMERRDQETIRLLEADLAKVEALVATAGGAPEAARVLVHAVIERAGALRRSTAVKAALTKHDAAVAPALAQIGRQKVAAARGRLSPAELSGLAVRATTRAFADVGADGAMALGKATNATLLDTARLLPVAMQAYGAQIKAIRPKKLDAKTQKAEKERGLAAAASCGAFETKLQESKKALLACTFGVDACAPPKVVELKTALDESRAMADAAYHEFDLARTGGAVTEAAALDQAAEGAGCREPWW